MAAVASLQGHSSPMEPMEPVTRHISRLVPRSSRVVVSLLVLSCMAQSATHGYDGSMMNGLNILPSYTDYFQLDIVTMALSTCSFMVGHCAAGFVSGTLCDRFGRRRSMLYAVLISTVGVVLQSAAQNIAMFIVGRIVTGFGVGILAGTAPAYLAESVPYRLRAVTLGLFFNFWYVGALLAAGITYGSSQMASTWAWRIPSILQACFGLICIALLPFLPESPRWLANQGRYQEAKEVLAATHSNGDLSDPIVLVELKKIVDMIEYGKTHGRQTLVQALKSSANRKRLLLTTSVAVFTMLSGNNIITFYLGEMLDHAGVTNSNTQLQINIVLNCFCLITSVTGSLLAERLGRRFLAISSTASLTLFIFIIGGLTKLYGQSTDISGIYGTVASIFLFQGCYGFGWTPLTVMYPPEVLSYPLRAHGMGLFTFVGSGVGLMVVFAFPIALAKIGWKIYMINGAWDVFELLFVNFYWIETKGKSLEEIDEMIEGVRYNDMPDLEDIRRDDLKGVDILIREEVVSQPPHISSKK